MVPPGRPREPAGGAGQPARVSAGLPKRATWVTDGVAEAEFAGRTRPDGSVVLRGRSRPWPVRPEPTSGLAVHVLDFTGRDAGPGRYQLVVGGHRSHRFRDRRRPVRPARRRCAAAVLSAALRLPGRRATRARLRPPRRARWRPPNRGDTAVAALVRSGRGAAVPRLDAAGLFDVSGGWYDAGDYGKYMVSGSHRRVAAAGPRRPAPPRVAPRRGRPRRCCSRSAAGSWTGCCGCRCRRPAAGRHGVPPGARHRVVADPGWAHEDPTDARPAPPVDGGHAAPRRGCRAGRPAVPAGRPRVRRPAARPRRAPPTRPLSRIRACSRPTTRARSAAVRTGTPTSATTSTGRPPSCGSPPARTLPRARCSARRSTRPTSSTRRLRLRPGRRAGPLDLALPAARLAGPRPRRRDVSRRRDRLLELQAAAALGAAVRAAGRLGLGLERAHPQQPRRARRPPTSHRRRGATATPSPRAWTTCSAATRSGRATSPATAPTSPATSAPASSGTTSTRLSAAAARSARRRRQLQAHPGFPSDPRLAGLPPQRCYLDEPTSETTNDVCIRWNAPLVYMATYLATPGPRARVEGSRENVAHADAGGVRDRLLRLTRGEAAASTDSQSATAARRSRSLRAVASSTSCRARPAFRASDSKSISRTPPSGP